MQIICIFAAFFLFKAVLSDVFTAVIKMECFVKEEKKMLDALGRYVVESLEAREDVPDSVVT